MEIEVKAREVFTIRKLHYDCILNGVPASNVAKMSRCIFKTQFSESFCWHLFNNHNLPNGWISFFSDLKIKNLQTESCISIFDAPEQDGIHISCILLRLQHHLCLLNVFQIRLHMIISSIFPHPI